jgi:hypothetical protein
VPVVNVEILDLDLDQFELGGYVTWQRPLDLVRVTSYVLYFASCEWALNQSTQPSNPDSVSSHLLPQARRLAEDSALGVFERAANSNQSVNATNSSNDSVEVDVSPLKLYNLTNDSKAELPDIVETVGPPLLYCIGFYDLLPLGEGVPWDANSTFVHPDQNFSGRTHILVFAKSVFAEQSTPGAVQFSDSYAYARDVSFIDRDLDANHIGGDDVLWQRTATDEHLVVSYEVYVSATAPGERRSVVGGVPVGTHNHFIPLDTYLVTTPSLPPLSHFLVYTRSSLVEQTTPAYLALEDAEVIVSNLYFPDDDLDEFEIGGNITWNTPQRTWDATNFSYTWRPMELAAASPFLAMSLYLTSFTSWRKMFHCSSTPT